MMDEIRIRDLRIYAYHGVLPEETRLGQAFYVNATLFLSTREAGMTDNLEHSVSYAEVCLFFEQFMKEHTYQLLESVAEQMARATLVRFPLLREIEIEIRKPQAPIPLPFESVSVCIRRGWHTVYVALGSNMGDKEQYLTDAVDKVARNPLCRVLQVADYIRTTPYGVEEQAEFLNSAMCIETLMEPEELLDFLQSIELEANRVRELRWGPRTLDLDILFYDDRVIRTERLLVPHTDMKNRDFVLVPLAQLNPWLMHPVTRKTIEEMLSELQERHVIKNQTI